MVIGFAARAEELFVLRVDYPGSVVFGSELEVADEVGPFKVVFERHVQEGVGVYVPRGVGSGARCGDSEARDANGVDYFDRRFGIRCGDVVVYEE